MQHIGATLMPSAFAFAILGPLVGLALIWGSTYVAILCQLVTSGGGDAFPALLIVWNAVVGAYAAAAIPAAVTGIWMALFSPFAEERSRFLAGAAAIGAVNTFLFMAAAPPIPGAFGGALFLAIVGAVSAFISAWLFQNAPLRRDEARKDRLAAERAERLAKERAAAKPAR